MSPAIPLARIALDVVRKIARRRQIDGGERVGQKGKGRNERERETNWKSPGKGVSGGNVGSDRGTMRKESPSSKPGNRASESVERTGREWPREERSEKIIEDEKKRRARKEEALSPRDNAK